VRSFRRLATLISSFVLLGSLSVAAPAGAATNDFQLFAVRVSLVGTHYEYQQTYRGLPVVDGYYAEHVGTDGKVFAVTDARKHVEGDVATRPGVRAGQAQEATGRRVPGRAGKITLSILPGNPARLVWDVRSTSSRSDTSTLVDAGTGKVLRIRDLIKDATGSGRVFDPNPVVTLRDQSLTDQDDTDYAALQLAYRTVPLIHLDGSGSLVGDYANIALKKNRAAFSPSLDFAYTRTADEFEQVMAYHDVTQAQTYIQSLGFINVNNESQDLITDKYTGDNSFYIPSQDTISLGSGGVDDAEDADVTWHEYGHAIQDSQVPGFGRAHDAGSIGEGFGDYWAVTMSEPVDGGYEVPCVADWDSVSYTTAEPHCLRRVDTNLRVLDETGEIHHDGQIWSRALWDIHQALGRTATDKIILESQFLFAPDTSFAAAAQATVDTAQRLGGSRAARVARKAFQSRGIL
jgi:fungalysin/thermolysin propeptide/fungalysin metallopeptidase (M36)